MNVSSSDQDRVVMVSAGFGVWRQGKCVGFTKWSGVSRIAEHTRESAAGTVVDLNVELLDGSQFDMPGDLPGSRQFLAEARGRLPRAFEP